MQPESKDARFLWDMLDAARAVKEFVAGGSFEDYTADRKLRGAVERHIEIIGEAAGRVSRAFRAFNGMRRSALNYRLDPRANGRDDTRENGRMAWDATGVCPCQTG